MASSILPASGHAQDSQWNRYTLEDLGGVFMEIDADEVCERAGVTASSLQAEATLLLIEGGVELLTMEQMLENIALPELSVALTCVEGSGVFAYSVSAKLQQAAQMVRDNQVSLPEAVTWYSDDLGIATVAEAADALQAAVLERLEAFVASYVAANATEGGPE